MEKKSSGLFCPCCSGKVYQNCCEPYHKGKTAENALILMRSRYSAYAKNLADYIILTTHSLNSAYSVHVKEWKKEILTFSKQTSFQGLKILEFTDGEDKAFVTFTAFLKRKNQNMSFTEKSYFEKVAAKWLYKSGEFF